MTVSDCEDDYRTGCPNVIVNSMLYLQVVIVDHYLRVIIPRYLYVINDPPCNSVYAAKRLNKRSLFIYLFMIWNFFLQQVQDLKKALDSQKVSYNEHEYNIDDDDNGDDDDTGHGGMMTVMMLTQWWWWW